MNHWLDMVVTLIESDTADLRELCRIAGGDPATFYQGIDISKLELSESDRQFLQHGEISDAVSRVKKAVRQEERVALLIAQILENRKVGLCAVVQYSGERAKFAQHASSVIRQSFNSLETSSANDILIAASLVRRLFTDVFPYNAGILLLYLAKHLGKYRPVNEAIQTTLARTNSMFVELYRDQIKKTLADAEQTKAEELQKRAVTPITN